jgi:uncharacterized protein involved in type VI secretion and phage assembly
LAGRKVAIKKVGTRFSGNYLITAATHIYNAQGYETHFSVSGRHPNTFSHLLGVEGRAEAQGMINGVVPALVTNVKDTDDLGRVKVKYAWLGEIESDWVRIASPFAGSGRGLMYLPEVNDEVLVAFEHGDVHHPYIIGVLWSNTDKSPLKNSEAVDSSGKVIKHIIKSRMGHTITLTDKDGEGQVSVISAAGATIVLEDKSGSEAISIIDKTKNNKLVIDSAKNSMTINVNGDFVVEAKGKITLNSTQDMTLDSKAKSTMTSMGPLSIESKAPATVKGVKLELTGNTMATLNGGPMTEVKGGLVKIN